jgi:hypothetical protein
MVRPGPAYLEAGRCVGGIVLRVYDVPAGSLLLERFLTSMSEAERLAVEDADFVQALTDECCLVAYDGDTGDRIRLQDVFGTDRL